MNQTPLPETIGIPIREANWPRIHAWTAPDGTKSLLATLGQNNGGLFVLDIDLETGHCQQFYAGLSGADYPTAAWRSPRTGVLYIGSAYPGHLHRYDRDGAAIVEDLGPIDPETAKFPTGIAEAPDGSIYVGACGKASLTRFEPGRDRFTRFGSLDPVDHYLYPCIGDDGTAVALIAVCRPHLVAFDLNTGQATEIGPPELAKPAGPDTPLFRGIDGLVYLEDGDSVFRIEQARLVPIESAPPRHHVAVRGQGTVVRFDDGTVAELHHRPDATNRRLIIRPPEAGATPRELELDWIGGGTELYRLHAGPDGCVYGSSLLPEHLFRYDPRSKDLKNLGQCSVSLGEAYSFVNQAGRFYIASYPKARLSVFDPAHPVHFGTEPGDNPRDLGRADDNSLRPLALTTGPDDSIWMGSAPDYGTTGGTLVSYQPTTEVFTSHGNLVPGCSPVSLCWLESLGRFLIGWSIEPGTGARPVARCGNFSFFDPDHGVQTEVTDFGQPDLPDVNSLLAASDGLVYGILSRKQFDGEADETRIAPDIFVLNPQTGGITARHPLPVTFGSDHPNCLFEDGGGRLWGMTTRCLFKIEPGTGTVTPFWTSDEDTITSCGAFLSGKAYFATGPTLRSIDLDPGKPMNRAVL